LAGVNIDSGHRARRGASGSRRRPARLERLTAPCAMLCPRRGTPAASRPVDLTRRPDPVAVRLRPACPCAARPAPGDVDVTAALRRRWTAGNTPVCRRPARPDG